MVGGKVTEITSRSQWTTGHSKSMSPVSPQVSRWLVSISQSSDKARVLTPREGQGIDS